MWKLKCQPKCRKIPFHLTIGTWCLYKKFHDSIFSWIKQQSAFSSFFSPSILVYREMKIRKEFFFLLFLVLKLRAEIKYLQKYGINRIEKTMRKFYAMIEKLRWKIVVFIKKKRKKMFCMMPACSHCVIAWWFRFISRFVCNEIWGENTFVIFSKWIKILSSS